jgi:hypothetical protein
LRYRTFPAPPHRTRRADLPRPALRPSSAGGMRRKPPGDSLSLPFGTIGSAYTRTDSSSASEPTANCVDVFASEPSLQLAEHGQIDQNRIQLSNHLPIDALLGNDRTTSRTRSRICWHAFWRGHMYSNRPGGFRNSKPRNAKPSATVVRRLFSWLTTKRKAANWFWRRSYACLASDSVRASSTISSA